MQVAGDPPLGRDLRHRRRFAAAAFGGVGAAGMEMAARWRSQGGRDFTLQRNEGALSCLQPWHACQQGLRVGVGWFVE